MAAALAVRSAASRFAAGTLHRRSAVRGMATGAIAAQPTDIRTSPAHGLAATLSSPEGFSKMVTLASTSAPTFNANAATLATADGASQPSTAPHRLQMVSLDVTGTIIRFKGHFGDAYCLAATRCGVPCPDYDKVYDGFKKAYEETSKRYPCFGYPNMETKEWWRMCVRRSFEIAGYEYSDMLHASIFQRVYSTFGSMRVYASFDDVLPFLSWVRKRGALVGVISNETERYSDSILPMFGLDEHLDFMVFSKFVGVEKPHRGIFEAAMCAAGVTDPSSALHIGDSVRKDYEGATKCGMRSLLLDRFGSPDADGLRKKGEAVCRDLNEVRKWMAREDLL